jgi:hypothetical protein
MALEVQNGLAQIHGIRNNGSAITIEGYASFLLDTAKATHKFKVTEGEDENGFDANLTATNAHVEIDLTFRPAGATRDAAEDVAVFLEPLSSVTLANFKIEEFNGVWIYIEGGSIDLSHATGTMNLKLRKYKDGDQNTSLSATITG